MKREQLYTESENAGTYILLNVDTFNKLFQLKNNLSQEDIDKTFADFIAPDLFAALLIGLKEKGYSED
jgi:hypothetical protein